MKKLNLFLILILASASVYAQLEEFPKSFDPNINGLLKQPEVNQFPYNNLRTADPSWFEEYMIAFQEELLYPGVSSCILKDGEVYWKYHHGYANTATSLPIDDQTTYTVASISKTIMITATMQLYEQGEFELEDDINDHLPFEVRNFHHPDDPITIEMLMTHTSSIQDNYNVLIPALHYGGDNPIPMDEFLAGYLQFDSAYFETDNYYGYTPGASWNYSNVGSCLLAYLVEIKTGLDFETYCQENVFGPLGMEETSYLFENMDPDHLAVPYTITGTNVSYTQQSSWPIYPIGNLKVSALQLAKHLGMYMKTGTFNDSVLLDASTVDLITELHYSNNSWELYMGLIWFMTLAEDFFSHDGRWFGFNTFYGFHKEEDYGFIWLSNGDNYNLLNETFNHWEDLEVYSSHYKPFSIESLSIIDADGDGFAEAGETIEIHPGIRNNTNTMGALDNLEITLAANNNNVTNVSDSTMLIGNIEYLEIKETPDDPFILKLSDQIEPAVIPLNITYHWGEEYEFSSVLELAIGHPEILLVSDEEDNRGIASETPNWYREVLDSLGYRYYPYELSVQGDPSPAFINDFPVVIWFTGFDSTNTLTTENQNLLMNYLDNGGKLFLSGQSISDELAGTTFLEEYLHVEHVEDSWSGNPYIFGVEGDPIGDGLAFVAGSGECLNNLYSPSVVAPLEEAHGIFTYYLNPETAAVRYASDTYKTVFFAFGFEAVSGYDNRQTILYRILNDYFGVIVGNIHEQVVESKPTLSIYPNPNSGVAHLSISLNEEGTVNVEVFSISGLKIKGLANEVLPAGTHDIKMDLSNLSAGVYYCTVKTEKATSTKKIIKVD